MPAKLDSQQREAVREAARRELAARNDRYFCKYYIKIIDKNKKQVPFVWNEVQQRIDDKVEALWAQGKPALIVVLKARQFGVSTYVQGKGICRACKRRNVNILLMAHREDSTEAIFEKAKYMHRNMPDGVRPMRKASNSQELIFDRPTGYRGAEEGLNSRIKMQTAGGAGVGISDTYDMVHASEYARYPGKPKETLTSIMNAVPAVAGVLVIIESTAYGYNDFKDLWDDAVAGKNDWVPMFFPWHVFSEYAMPCGPGEAEAILGSLNEYEQKIRGLYNLTPEQIKWYRWTLANKCGGSVNKMRQENPSYPEEAFVFTGRPVFDNEAVQLRIEELRKIYRDPEKAPKIGKFTFERAPGTGRIVNDTIRFVEDPNGWVKVYQAPLQGHPYTLGGDTKGEGHDYYTATAKDNSSGRRVATLKMQINTSKPYTEQIYCMGTWYKQALIGVEINFNTAPVEDLEDWGYPRQYIRQTYDKTGVELQKRHGWKTDSITRPLIIDRETEIVDGHPELFWDIETLQEMLTFRYDEDNRPDAMEGEHDDLLFSDMIAQEIGGQQRCGVLDEPKQAKQRLIDKVNKGNGKHRR